MKPLMETLQEHKRNILDFAEKFQFKNVYLFVDVDDGDGTKNDSEIYESPAKTSLYLVVDVDKGGNPNRACLLEAKLIELLDIDVQVIIKRNITNAVRLEYIMSRCVSLDNAIEKINEWLDGMLKKYLLFSQQQLMNVFFKDSTLSQRQLERTLDLAEKFLKSARCDGNKYKLYQPHENEPKALTEEMIEFCLNSTKKDQVNELMRTLSPLQLQELTEELIARRYRAKRI